MSITVTSGASGTFSGTYAAVEPTTITDVFIDGKKLRRSQWYMKGGTIHFEPGLTVTNGQTISVEITEGGDAWKFGDILSFGGTEARLMFLSDRDDGTANMLVLDDPTASHYPHGLIRNFHPSMLTKVTE